MRNYYALHQLSERYVILSEFYLLDKKFYTIILPKAETLLFRPYRAQL